MTGGDFLSREEGRTLLRIARDSLSAYLARGERIPLGDYPLTPALRAPHGAFVTLRNRGQLRGCIGNTRGTAPLAETVRDYAINAATRDPRFMPVNARELPEILIEVSALAPGEEPGSPFIRVESPEEIVIGRDGVMLELAEGRGGALLLPQVAPEYGWGVEQLLAALCQKAHAEPRAWERPGNQLYRFSAQVFEE